MSRIATDLLRIFAVTCIVFNHVSWPLFVSSASASGGMLAHISAIFNQLGKPSVLFFLFLSGLAFSGKREHLTIAGFYRSRLLRILPPFLLFSLIFFLASGDSFELLSPVGWLFAGTAHYHLYFVAVLLYLYLCYPLLREIPYKPSYLFTLIGVGIVLHLINSFRYDAPLPIFLGHRLAELGDLTMEQPGGADNRASVVWLEYFAFAVPFFMAGLWMPQIVQRHSFLKLSFQSRNLDPEGNGLWTRLGNLKAGSLFQLILRGGLVVGGFLLVFNDFVLGYKAGLHPDPAGRVWRISVALYAVALIVFLLALPQKSSPDWVKKLSRASFLVYLLHPLWIEATRFLHPYYQTQVVIPLSWLTALALHELALSFPALGFLLGEGDRLGISRATEKSGVSDEPSRK
ncbi:MAG: acyltransferase family protein [Leptospiraceae bacterium]